MVTMHILYDDSVFSTNDEHESISVQSEIEQPEIHMFVLGSSSTGSITTRESSLFA